MQPVNRQNNSILIFIAAENFSSVEYRIVREMLIKNGYGIFVTSDAKDVCVGDDDSKVRPEVPFYNIRVSNFAGIVVIGGKGIATYFEDPGVLKIIKNFHSANKLVAAICAAPVLLLRSGVLLKGAATCHPAYKQELISAQIDYSDNKAVINGNIITGTDVSASVEFAGALIKKLSNNKI